MGHVFLQGMRDGAFQLFKDINQALTFSCFKGAVYGVCGGLSQRWYLLGGKARVEDCG